MWSLEGGEVVVIELRDDEDDMAVSTVEMQCTEGTKKDVKK